MSLTFGPEFAGGNIWAVADRQWGKLYTGAGTYADFPGGHGKK